MSDKKTVESLSTESGSGPRIPLAELLDIPAFQDLFDSFFQLTGIPTAVLDLRGTILIACGWRRICTQFHRKHAATASRCLESDTILAGQLKQGEPFNLYRCKNGLIDAAAPIVIGNRHIGNLFAGQFLFEQPDTAYFARQAEAFGFDKDAYLEALTDVPILSRKEVETTMAYLIDLTVVIASAGMDKKRLLDLNRDLEREIRVRTKDLEKEKTVSESLISSLPGVMYVIDQDGRFVNWNHNLEIISGHSGEQIRNKSPLDLIAAGDRSRVQRAIEKVFREGRTSIEAGFATITGEAIPYLFTGHRYTLDNNDYLIGVGLDISDRIQSEKEKEALIARLQEALADVKRLSGLLPICASCKKIRDDQGYWNQIESYIHEHSQAKFTHGLCPECSDKIYGDQAWYVRMKKKKDG